MLRDHRERLAQLAAVARRRAPASDLRVAAAATMRLARARLRSLCIGAMPRARPLAPPAGPPARRSPLCAEAVSARVASRPRGRWLACLAVKLPREARCPAGKLQRTGAAREWRMCERLELAFTARVTWRCRPGMGDVDGCDAGHGWISWRLACGMHGIHDRRRGDTIGACLSIFLTFADRHGPRSTRCPPAALLPRGAHVPFRPALRRARVRRRRGRGPPAPAAAWAGDHPQCGKQSHPRGQACGDLLYGPLAHRLVTNPARARLVCASVHSAAEWPIRCQSLPPSCHSCFAIEELQPALDLLVAEGSAQLGRPAAVTGSSRS